ncbi:PREDICTED: alanine aminotransferase 1 [Haliaeetus leucocephalus]|uniref:alanine aminotransferase 1 n=1 Tax=Haliaeetus leucocephalus TaxID=52644 RepID=UPI00053CD794|nr:PREDICTED: alanine aminotransferase 1 [Haliaeetus leucocephalus]
MAEPPRPREWGCLRGFPGVGRWRGYTSSRIITEGLAETLQPSLTSMSRAPNATALPWALLLLGEVLVQDAAAQGCLLPPAAYNAALGRPASQSSVFPNISIAVNAVDGNRDGVWQHGSCSHTRREREPWWSVDLGGRRAVAAVVVKNRQDCCWERLRGAQVHVGDAPARRSRDNPVCGTITDAGPGSLSTICCQGLPGRYVSILIPGREDTLVLCEVEVVLQGCLPLPGALDVARGRPVAQSSTLNAISLAANAVDGNGDADWERGSCAHTEMELEPWWRVDLGRRHAVYAVTITNRRDCCWESLLGAQVHVGDSLADHGKHNPVCGAILETGPGSTTTVCCNGLPGRYISVIIPGREDFLVLCEVEVTAQSCFPPPGAQNLALRRPAAQSSTAGRAGSAVNAVDGNRDGNWRHGSCSQTEREPEPWWTVDLGRRRAVEAVVVRNRLDCCWHRLKGARVHVGDSLAGHGTNNPICGTITDTSPGSTSTVCCHGLRGRYVTVTIPGREERLSLCEVEVVEQGCAALPGAQNVALGRPATQSSVLDAGSGAANAVDGNRDSNWEHGSCAHTTEEPEPWWRVDLGRRHAVYAVVVKNRHDCCWERLKGAEIHVGNSLVDRGRRNPVCGIITDAGPGSLSTVCCHGLRGRYVSILIPGREDALVLCEVEVVAACACPELLGSPAVPEAARHRARSILREMDAGNIGGYNHQHRALGVPTRVARFLERRDGGVPCHPRNVVLCSGTASILPLKLEHGDVTNGGAGEQEEVGTTGFGHRVVVEGEQGWVEGVPRPPHGPPRLSLLLPAETLERVLLALTRFHAAFLRDFS